MTWMKAALAALTLLASALFPAVASAQRETLSVAPVAQQTPVWCWAATIEMAFRHYGAPNLNPYGNMQCAVVATLHPQCAANCGTCIVSGGTTANMVMSINAYRQFAYNAGAGFPNFSYYLAGRLGFYDIVDSIDADDPLIAGISPSGMGGRYPPTMSEHAVIIVGYDEGNASVIVNDPYPYPPGFDPYIRFGGMQLQPGRYEISYTAFTQGLGYKDTIIFAY